MMKRKILFIIPLLLILLSNFVLADIIPPSIGLKYIPIWLIIIINFAVNFLVILLALFILKELPKSKIRILILTMIITVLGLIVDFFIEGMTYPGWNTYTFIALAISIIVFIAYVTPLSKSILKLPLKKAAIIGLMIGILTNPIIIMNIVNPETLQYSSIDNCKTDKNYFYFSTSCFNEVAIQKRDIKVCNEIKQFLEEAEQRRHIDMPEEQMEGLPSREERAIQECKSEWYKEVPKTKKDLEICNSAESENLRNICIESIAKNLKDISICDMTVTTGYHWAGSWRNACIREVALILDDISICDEIDNPSGKENCISSIQSRKENCQRVLLENPPTCGDNICTKEEDCFPGNKCFNGQEYIENCPYGCPMDCSRMPDFYKCISDSDGGKNIYKSGVLETTKYDLNRKDQCMTKTSDRSYSGIKNECSGDSCYVLEVYCDGDSIKEEYILCPTQCKDGTCIQ